MHLRNGQPGGELIEMSQAQKCKRLHAEGVSIRRIASTLEIARNTVRRYVRGEQVPGQYQMRAGRPQPAREPVRARVHELLTREREKETPKKQRLTASRIHRMLEGEGSTASERTVRSAVMEVRLEMRDALKNAYLPLEYLPAEDAQVDFYEGVADGADGVRVKVFILLVRACYSGRCFAYAAPNQTREALLEGLMRSFDFFGGVFKNLWFDNLTPAVKKVLKGRSREMQVAFQSFAAHYGFEPQFCGPAKGNEKGGVEGEVKYQRIEILSPIPTIDGREDLQRLCAEWMERDQSRTIRGREQSIGEMWREEAADLIDQPPVRFEVAMPKVAKVSLRSWVQTGTNFYSVPVRWCGREVTMQVDAERVVIIGPGGARVEHVRMYGREMMSLELDHYLDLLERKHRGLDRAVPVRRFLEAQDVCWSTLLRELRKREGEVQGGKSFVDVLFLCRKYTTQMIVEAIRKTLSHGCVSVGIVRFYLHDDVEQAAPQVDTLDYPGPDVQQASIERYSALLSPLEVDHA